MADRQRAEISAHVTLTCDLAELSLLYPGVSSWRVLIAEEEPDLKECLECDLKLEMIAHPDLKMAVEAAEAARDYVSRDLFRKILESEEEHIDFLETQLELIRRVGIQNYQQTQITPKGD